MDIRIQNEPSDVCHEHGIVLIDGPNGCAISMSPRAARETARRMIDAADAALHDETEPDDGSGW